MLNLKENRAKFVLVLSYVGFIYLTLPVMRPVLNFLKDNLGKRFDLSTNLVLIAAMVVIFLIFIKSRFTWKQWLVSMIVFSLYLYSLKILKIPEERIHLLEYGFLSFLVFKIYLSTRTIVACYWPTFLTVSFIGTLDEIIQYYLPNRVGDVRDIILNIFSGLLGLVLTAVFYQKTAKNLPNSSHL